MKAKALSRPPLVVGLTGGIGSGKSTVLSLLRERGIAAADADVIVHGALRPGRAGHRRVLALFGPAVRRADGSLDRAAMARVVFRNPDIRKKLEAILHPIVVREFRRRIAAHRRGLLVLDVPLLFETGLDRLVDRTVVVWAPERTCLSRLASSGRLTRAQARRRMAAQMPLAEKRRRAHFLLDNSRTLSVLGRGVDRLFGVPGGGGPLPLVYNDVTTS